MSISLCCMTYCGLVTPYCVIIGSGYGVAACVETIYYLNQCWLIVNWTLTNHLEILTKIKNFSNMKMCLKMSSAEWQPFSSSLTMWTKHQSITYQYHKDRNWLQQTPTFSSFGTQEYKIIYGIDIGTWGSKVNDFHMRLAFQTPSMKSDIVSTWRGQDMEALSPSQGAIQYKDAVLPV